ncbi:MAG: ImmA/IrrE family metallo-endopeptidase, partial [Cellulosilyticaceae bacterium]
MLNSNENFAYHKAINFRDKYRLGNYCAKELIQILEMVEISERTKIKLIRTPFDNNDLAGFIGY